MLMNYHEKMQKTSKSSVPNFIVKFPVTDTISSKVSHLVLLEKRRPECRLTNLEYWPIAKNKIKKINLVFDFAFVCWCLFV